MDAKLSLLDVMQRRGESPIDRKVVEDVAYVAPVFSKFPVSVIAGTTYRQLHRTGLPLIGARPLNAGVGTRKASYETKNHECFFYDGLVALDKGVAMSDREGVNAMMADEMEAHMKGAFINLERSLFYGKAVSKYGIDGLAETMGDYMTISVDPASVSKAEDGTVTCKKGGASVWALNLRPDALDIIFGNDRTIAFGPQKEQLVACKTAEGKEGQMNALTRSCQFWIGLRQRSLYAAGRLVNESANAPLKDEHLAELLNCFPANQGPTVLVMNRYTRARLQKSRAAAMVYQKRSSGQTPYAELPTEYEGIPIIVTDMLLQDETDANVAALASMDELTADYIVNKSNLKRV